MRTAPAILLNPEQRTALERLARARSPSRPAWWREPGSCCWPRRGWKTNRLHGAWASCRKQQRGGGGAFWKAASQRSIRMRRDRASRALSPTVR